MVGEPIALPAFSEWNLATDAAVAMKDDSYGVSLKPGAGQLRVAAVSPVLNLTPGSQYVFEFEVRNSRDSLDLRWGRRIPPSWLESYTATRVFTPERLPEPHSGARFYLRLMPRYPQNILRLLDYGTADGEQIRLVSLYRSTPTSRVRAPATLLRWCRSRIFVVRQVAASSRKWKRSGCSQSLRHRTLPIRRFRGR